MIAGTAATTRADVHVAEGVLVGSRWKLAVINPSSSINPGWSGPLFPKVKAEPGTANRCNTSMPCLWDLDADPQERADPFARPATNRVLVLTARALNAIAHSRVTLSL